MTIRVLTPVEERVAALVAAGRSSAEAADELGLSPRTVDWHLSRVYRKLGARSRAELPERLYADVARLARRAVLEELADERRQAARPERRVG